MIAFLAVFLQALHDNSFQLRLDIMPQGGDCGRINVDDFVHHSGLMASVEGHLSRKKFEQKYTERENVGPLVCFNSLGLFWGHIADCSNSAPHLSKFGDSSKFRQTEVHHLNSSVFPQHDVLCFHVTMNNAFFVCSGETFGYLDPDICDLTDGESLLRFTQSFSIDVFHHDKRLSLGLVDFIDYCHVGMVECRCRLSFHGKSVSYTHLTLP